MKTVLITGANGNLGSVVTAHFLQLNFRVIATVHDEKSKSEFTSHPNLFIETVDLSNEMSAGLFIHQTITSYGNIDAAFLLAGGYASGKIENTSSSDIKKQLVLNFDTAYHVAKPLFMHMLEKNYGRIVFIGSRPALKPEAGKDSIAYALSKSLLFKLSEFMNASAKGKNVTSTVLVPSTIDTPANRKSMPDADPSKWVRPESIADTLEFIVSEKSLPLRETVLKLYGQS